MIIKFYYCSTGQVLIEQYQTVLEYIPVAGIDEVKLRAVSGYSGVTLNSGLSAWNHPL